MSKEDKEKILRNLTSWSVEGRDEFITTNWFYCGGPGPFIRLEESEAKEVKRVIIETVRNNSQKWRIEEKQIFVNAESFFLVHHSVKEVENGIGDQIIRNFGKVHNKKGFTDEEWQEVESIIRDAAQQIQPEKSKVGEYLGWVFGVLLVSLFAWFIIKKTVK